MEQYISRSAIKAEIERRKKEAESNCGGYKSYNEHLCDSCTVGFYEEFLEILDALEVKEVDLGKEFDDYIEKQNAFTNNDNSEIKYYNGDSFNHVYDIYPIARHFYELGLRAKGK